MVNLWVAETVVSLEGILYNIRSFCLRHRRASEQAWDKHAAVYAKKKKTIVQTWRDSRVSFGNLAGSVFLSKTKPKEDSLQQPSTTRCWL